MTPPSRGSDNTEVMEGGNDSVIVHGICDVVGRSFQIVHRHGRPYEFHLGLLRKAPLEDAFNLFGRERPALVSNTLAVI